MGDDLLGRIVEYLGPDNGTADFLLVGGQTLSAKSNKIKTDKVCPNRSGQPTASSWVKIFHDLYEPHATEDILTGVRYVIRNRTAMLLRTYVMDLFKTDYTLWVGVEGMGYIGELIDRHRAFRFTQTKIGFTNETADFTSLTIKYEGLTLGEFQIHGNRDTIKFRFRMKNLLQVLSE
jgi:hypothetical protein